jgi:DNA-binding NtrC family response regulator
MKSKKNRLKKRLRDVEAQVVLEALEKFGWRLTPTMEFLGLPLSTLQSVIQRNERLKQAYKKHGHGPGRPFGSRNTPESR